MKVRFPLRARRVLLYLNDSPLTIKEIVDLERQLFKTLINTRLTNEEKVHFYEHYLYWKAIYKLRQLGLVWKFGRNYFLTKTGKQLVKRWLSNKLLLLEELTPLQIQNNKEGDDGVEGRFSQTIRRKSNY